MDEQFKTSQQQIPPSTHTRNQQAIPGEIVIASHVDSHSTLQKRLLEFEQLQQNLAVGVITQDEYEYLLREILNKYPL